MTRPLLSIVIPARNEEENIAKMHAALCTVTEALAVELEIVFVDDGSQDATRERIAGVQKSDPRVKLVILTRNFGHQAALLAGMEASHGDAVLTLDCDLQHPPSLIPDMVAAWQSGVAVVETIRDNTEDASRFKKLSSRLFYRFMNALSESPITAGAADFRLLDRAALNDLLRLPDQRPFIRGMVAWLGHPHTALHYVAGARSGGRSSYSLKKMISLAIDAITAFSAKPLRVAFHVGLIASVLTLVYLTLIIWRWARGEVVEGWTSLMVVVLFLGATQLITLGILGEYIGRIYDQTRGRPRYLTVSETRDRDRNRTAP